MKQVELQKRRVFEMELATDGKEIAHRVNEHLADNRERERKKLSNLLSIDLDIQGDAKLDSFTDQITLMVNQSLLTYQLETKLIMLSKALEEDAKYSDFEAVLFDFKDLVARNRHRSASVDFASYDALCELEVNMLLALLAQV